MNIVQITPGAGGMYCGGCLRDNALVTALRQFGHDTLMVPLYLPLTLDEPDQSAGAPIFFGGINVYLEQKSTLFCHMPVWLHRALAAPVLLKWAAGRAAKTRAAEAGELTLSMIRGEEGNQARELDELIGWLKAHHRPDVVCLSNSLLVGMARRLKAELGAPVVCMLQGEDTFLDALPESLRAVTWQTLAERAADVDQFIAPSRYFADLMRQRLHLPADRVGVVYNGINLDGFGSNQYSANSNQSASAKLSTDSWTLNTPVLGYFARMCKEKGLDTLVEAYLLLRKRASAKNLRLQIGGCCGPGDEPFVNQLRERLSAAGVLGDVKFFPNVDRAGKLEFFRSLSVFSTPALYGEAFGLYVIEALAAGVPVAQPRHAAFPELIEATGGGLLCEPGDPKALADAIESLLLDPARARDLGQRGQRTVQEKFSAERMAEGVLEVLRQVVTRKRAAPRPPAL